LFVRINNTIMPIIVTISTTGYTYNNQDNVNNRPLYLFYFYRG